MGESQVLKKLEEILSKHKHKRVCVVAPTCTGKSYLLKHIPYALDMDELVFPKLSAEEERYVMSKPWTEDVGNTMARLANQIIKIESGRPVFGTVVLESDYLIYLKISDSLLKERIAKRGKDYNDVKNMQAWIEGRIKEYIKKNKVQYEEVDIE